MNPGQQDIPTTAEALVAAISAQRDRRCWKKSSTTEAQFRAAVERFGDDNHAISAELDITISAINRRRVRLGLPRKMVWNAESKRRLLEMATRTPRPSTAELAEAFDATEGAIQTALSRRGVAVVVIPGDVALRNAVEQQPRLRFAEPRPTVYWRLEKLVGPLTS